METANRSVLRGQITRIVKSATEYLSSNESQIKEENADKFDAIEEELLVFQERLTVTRDSLNAANKDLRSSIKKEDFGKECEAIAEYEDKVVTVLTRLKQRLAKVKQRQRSVDPNLEQAAISSEVQRSAFVKLPKLQLAHFSGNFKEWLPFWEQYRTSIHENPKLSDVDKFNYLKSLLSGKAADSIAGFTPTESCYAAAIALLMEEFGNSEKIVDKNMQQLISLSPLSSRFDTVGLRRLYNTVMSSTRSLTALGIPSSHYYIMLKSVLLKCIPHDLRAEFYRHTQETPEPSKMFEKVNDGNSDASLGSETSAALCGEMTEEVFCVF